MLLVPDDCEGPSSVNESQSFSPWDPARNKDILGVPQLQRMAERFASSAVEVVSTGNEVQSLTALMILFHYYTVVLLYVHTTVEYNSR